MNNGSSYNGRLRLYVVEPTSRWDNDDRDPYHFGFLDFAFDDTLSIPYHDTYSNTIIWDGNQAGYSNIKETNIMVIATVFNPEINKGYSDPPFGNPFDAYYVDATAGAKPGETNYNTVNENFTHTVFVEEATATWCPYCPAMVRLAHKMAMINPHITGDMVEAVEFRDLSMKYGVMGVPKTIINETESLEGAVPEPMFLKKVEEVLKQ